MGSLSFLQGIFPTQELNLGLLHCRQILYQLSQQGRPSSLRYTFFFTNHPTLSHPLSCRSQAEVLFSGPNQYTSPGVSSCNSPLLRPRCSDSAGSLQSPRSAWGSPVQLPLLGLVRGSPRGRSAVRGSWCVSRARLSGESPGQGRPMEDQGMPAHKLSQLWFGHVSLSPRALRACPLLARAPSKCKRCQVSPVHAQGARCRL